MALETALKFLERMEREETLRTQLYISRPGNLVRLTQFARGKGFIVSEKDMAEALEQYQEQFATGSIAPLRDYAKQYKPLPEPAQAQALEAGDES